MKNNYGGIYSVPFSAGARAFVGTFTAIWSELVYIRAMRDGKIDTAERTST